MLKARVLTALLLVPIVLASILWLSPQWFLLLTAIVTLYAAWEWGKLTCLNKYRQWLLITLLFFLMAFTSQVGINAIPMQIFYVSLAFWLVGLVIIVRFPHIPAWLQMPGAQILLGALVLWPAWLGFNLLKGWPFNALVWLLVIVWVADSAAYFIGSYCGQHKLMPQVSPKKSLEGLFGALVVTSLIIIIATQILWANNWITVVWLVLWTNITVLFSAIGDLFISVFKRLHGVKDTGVCLPGHGGLLDRIDSLLAATPVFIVSLIIYSKLL